MKDLRAYLSALAAGADDRHRAGFEEPGHRGGGCPLRAVRRFFLEVGRGRQGHNDAVASGARPPLHRETAVGEDVEHARVRPWSPGLEGVDVARAGDLGEAFEQARSDALALQGLFDGEGHLGPRRVGRVADVVRYGDDPARAFADVSKAIAVVHRAGGRGRLGVGPVDAEEAKVRAVGGQAPLEVEQSRRIREPDGPQAQSRPRAQDDVRLLMHGIFVRRSCRIPRCAGRIALHHVLQRLPF